MMIERPLTLFMILAGLICGEAARSVPPAAPPMGFPQLNLPTVADEQQAFDNTFPDTVSGEAETCGNAARHLKSLEDWRKTQLEDIVRRLAEFDTAVQSYDQWVEKQRAQRAISDADYNAWQVEMSQDRKLTSSDGPWLVLYRSWANSMRQEIGKWTGVKRRNDCD